MRAYTTNAAKFEKKPGKLTLERIDSAEEEIDQLWEDLAVIGERVKALKRRLFYGPPGEELSHSETVSARGLHFDLGLLDEAIEVATATGVEHRLEELGDLLWFLARAAFLEGKTITQLGAANLAKLKKRYPAKKGRKLGGHNQGWVSPNEIVGLDDPDEPDEPDEERAEAWEWLDE